MASPATTARQPQQPANQPPAPQPQQNGNEYNNVNRATTGGPRDPKDAEIQRLRTALDEKTKQAEQLQADISSLAQRPVTAFDNLPAGEKIQKLKEAVAAKDLSIKHLTKEVARLKRLGSAPRGRSTDSPSTRAAYGTPRTEKSARGRAAYAGTSDGPVTKYVCNLRTDAIDVRLEEFYNATSSAIQIARINKGLYRFGGTQVEMDIINQKLMCRTDDGWNRGKFGPIEKFIAFFEPIERERLGIPLER
mmetsp:Transcript_74894/g.199664  ORF Transcript_74894/g.199664 Transcript_74894/m.199664 type:complete len:249 (+) Transcript_74894:106-852(+)